MKESIVMLALFSVAVLVYWFGMRYPIGKYSRDWQDRRYTVETFTPDLTITIKCSGDCDLVAMIAEAREAAK